MAVCLQRSRRFLQTGNHVALSKRPKSRNDEDKLSRPETCCAEPRNSGKLQRPPAPSVSLNPGNRSRDKHYPSLQKIKVMLSRMWNYKIELTQLLISWGKVIIRILNITVKKKYVCYVYLVSCRLCWGDPLLWESYIQGCTALRSIGIRREHSVSNIQLSQDNSGTYKNTKGQLWASMWTVE